MANEVFNVARGRIRHFVDEVDSGSGELRVFLLKANETEADLIDHDDMDSLFGAAGNTEADFSGYTNKVTPTDFDITTPAQDDTNDRLDIDIDDIAWTSAGAGNTLTKLIVGYDADGSDTDTTTIPLTHHDFAVSTDGSDLVANIDANGFYRSTVC
jgi:hypothetical protein